MQKGCLKNLFLIVFLFICFQNFASDYRFKRYKVEDGLPINIIKSVFQDSLGFIWIASDDGLIKFDALSFQTFSKTFVSNYIKGIVQLPNGKLICAGDLDIVEIDNQIDTVIIKTVIKGSRNLTDSTIFYPKTIYKDRKGNVWLGEPDAAVLYRDGKMKRFEFGEAHRSCTFIRSFDFFEDEDGIVYAVSYAGAIFKFSPDLLSVELMDNKLMFSVNKVLYINKKLYVATNSGLYVVEFVKGKLGKITKTALPNNISYVALDQDSVMWLSTFNESMLRVEDYRTMQFEILPYQFNSINSFFIAKNKDIWVATDNGLVLIQKNIFTNPDQNRGVRYIECIEYDNTKDELYYCSKDNLFRFSVDQNQKLKLTASLYTENGYYQSIRKGKRGLWLSSESEIWLLDDNFRIIRKWNFSKEGSFIHETFLDSKQNLWICSSRSRDAIVITDSFTVIKYPIPLLPQSDIRDIKEDDNGIYVACGGISKYLFYKKHGENEFKEVKAPLDFDLVGELNIQAIAVLKNNVWIGSSEGLLKYDGKVIQKVNLGETFSTYSISSIEVYDDESILFSNSSGLFKYHIGTNEFRVFDENIGLPSNTITFTKVDKYKRTWVATSNGIAYANPISELEITPTPFCVNVKVNGVNKLFMKELQLPYGVYVNMKFTAITFPENKISFQWKMKGDQNWQEFTNHELSFSNLEPGDYTLQVRAKKNTGLGWSLPLEMSFSVNSPYWKRFEFVILIVLLLALIVYTTFLVSDFLSKERREELQSMVKQQTQELQAAYDELKQRNNELDRFVYSASHDLGAPLKSILGLIQIAKLEPMSNSLQEYLKRMEASVRKLDEFIKEVISYSRNTRMELEFVDVNFKSIVESALEDHQYSTNFDKIEFRISPSTDQIIKSDLVRLKIILNNLLSNAIKFHIVDNVEIKPYVSIDLSIENGKYYITVEDNGRGIGKEYLDSIFDMFFRATSEVQGSGLGLYILKEAVVKLGGTISVDSELGKGAKFTVILPAPTIK